MSFFSQQPIQKILQFDTVVGFDKIPIHRQYDFLVIIRNHPQRPKLPLTGLLGKHALRYLDIHLVIRLFRNEIHLCFANLSDTKPIVPAQQLQIHDVL